MNPTLTIEGRPGHAECVQPDWREGGAVNAIEKLRIVLEAIRDLREDWRQTQQPPSVLGPPDIVPTVVKGGEWMVTYPSSCSLTFDVQYLPARVDAEAPAGRSSARWRKHRSGRFLRPLVAEHPVEWEWPCDIVPAEVPTTIRSWR